MSNFSTENSVKDSSASPIRIFENADFGKVRARLIDGEPWFVGKDIADVLGYENNRKALADHVDEEDKMLVQLSDFQDSNETLLPDHMKGSKIVIINESGLYSLILRSNLPSAKSFKSWITHEVLPSIRKTGSYSINQGEPIKCRTADEIMSTALLMARGLKELLNASDSSVAAYLNKAAMMIGTTEIDYVASKGVRLSATALLQSHGRKESPQEFNKKMEEKGFLKTCERASTSSKNGKKRFKALVGKGLDFGENVVSPKNEREVHPLYLQTSLKAC